MKLIVIIFFTLCSLFITGQDYQPLKSFDFEKENYMLVGIPGLFYQDTNKFYANSWYADNPELLEHLKDNWKLTKFKSTRDFIPRPWSFEIYLLREGKPVKHFTIESDRDRLTDSTGSYFTNIPKILAPFADEIKLTKIKEKNFSNLKLARKHFKQIHDSPNLVYAPEPDWMNFEGKLTFNYYVPEGEHYFDWELKKKIISDIRNTYPSECFDFHSITYLNGKLHSDSARIELKCNRSLSTAFNLYDKSTPEWSPYVLYLKSYWKSKKRLTKNRHH